MGLTEGSAKDAEIWSPGNVFRLAFNEGIKKYLSSINFMTVINI
jgi:hypothetical protein